MSRRPSRNGERQSQRAAVRLGSLLRLAAGRRILLPAERAKLAAAVALMEDAFGVQIGRRRPIGRAGGR